MDGLLKNDFFTFPLVLETPNIKQQVNLINCNGWQLEVDKDEPIVILDNGDVNLQDVSEYPFIISSGMHVGKNTEEIRESKSEDVGRSEIAGAVELHGNVQDNCRMPELPITKESNLVDDLVETHLQVLVTYKCRLCPFKTEDKSSFSTHLNKVHLKVGKEVKLPGKLKDENAETSKEIVLPEDETTGKMVYLCGNCTEAFITFSECRVHMAAVHKIMIGSNMALKGADLKDDIDYVTREEINGNIKVVKKEKKKAVCDNKAKYLCPVGGCFVKLSSKDFIEKHKSCHIQDAPRMFSCPKCNEEFKKWNLCANHLWKIHQEDVDLFLCSTCEYKTAFRDKLYQHEKIHKDGKDFLCVVCGKNFKQKVQLRNHQVFHLKRIADDQIPNWIKRRECDQCNKTFSDSKALKKHVQAVHSKLKPYVCQVCGHFSATKSMLQIHFRQHSGEKPFTCKVCNFSTGDHNTLRRHILRHSGVKPYQCQHCSYAAIQSCALKTHLAKVHPGKSGMFSCSKCSFSTVSSKAFLHHRHDNEKAKPEEDKPTHLIYLPYDKTKESDSVNKNGPGEFIAINFAEVLMPEEEETSNYFENDLGGITIPAEPNVLPTVKLNITQPDDVESTVANAFIENGNINIGGITIPTSQLQILSNSKCDTNNQ